MPLWYRKRIPALELNLACIPVLSVMHIRSDSVATVDKVSTCVFLMKGPEH